jgi:di/tricarboxylate transporter
MAVPLLGLLVALGAGWTLWRERLPLELGALCLVLAAVLAGWLTPDEALSGFANRATLTVVAMFVISAAVVRTGALAPLEGLLQRFGGQHLSQQLLVLCAPLLLPGDHGSSPGGEGIESDYGLQHYLSELLVAERSPLVGRSVDATLLQHTFDVRVLALRDQQGLDLLPEVSVALVSKGQGSEGQREPEVANRTPSVQLSIAEVLVPGGSRLIGQTLLELRFSQRFNGTVLAIRRGEEVLRDRLGFFAAGGRRRVPGSPRPLALGPRHHRGGVPARPLAP